LVVVAMDSRRIDRVRVSAPEEAPQSPEGHAHEEQPDATGSTSA